MFVCIKFLNVYFMSPSPVLILDLCYVTYNLVSAMFSMSTYMFSSVLYSILDDQTHVDSKPAGQPEQSSLNQCQLIAANRPKLVLQGVQASPVDGFFLI